MRVVLVCLRVVHCFHHALHFLIELKNPYFISSIMQNVVRSSDIRVSERTPLNSLRLKPFGPIYNELAGEV